MAGKLEVGQKVRAEFSDGKLYAAEVKLISTSEKRSKAPIKVHFVDYGAEDDAWVSLDKVKVGKGAKGKKKPEAPAPVDYSGLSKGMRVQAASGGVFYAAEVLEVSTAPKRAKAPVKVRFAGYTAESDAWVGGSDLRSKALKAGGAPSAGKKADTKPPRRTHSLADQVARFERAKKEKNTRYLDIAKVYDGSKLKGKRVVVVGASKGLGLCIAQELVAVGAEAILTVRAATPEINALGAKQIVTDVEVTDLASMKAGVAKITGPVDYLIFNAGYFPNITDNLDSMQTEEAIKQIDICALGPLRCVSAFKSAGLLKGCKVAIISSQAGSTQWRFTQNKDKGGDYGHHMSRAACNIGGAIMSEELKKDETPIVMLHPGFNRTGMTAKYSHIWDMEGAVEPSEGAKRVLHEVQQISMKISGQFINCEDGLRIPW